MHQKQVEPFRPARVWQGSSHTGKGYRKLGMAYRAAEKACRERNKIQFAREVEAHCEFDMIAGSWFWRWRLPG
jgi:hypothetical protein